MGLLIVILVQNLESFQISRQDKRNLRILSRKVSVMLKVRSEKEMPTSNFEPNQVLVALICRILRINLM